mmetsp:Transcript_107752/g.285587  ORF Transcript_107752/g.285587 Transcript_107752/m.285587 type:complete len:470 (-) Transcript_107752:388-1797(-)
MHRQSHSASMSVLASSQPAVVVAQQLSDLLLAFPSAAAGGVQWSVLAKKYEERYKVRLDVQALGHSSALAAATTLLWEVLRIVDKQDTDNPVVGVDDAVALAPRPGLLGCWPSLYHALCQIVLENGVPDGAPPASAVPGRSAVRSCSLLLSQIRPLLERYWHANFDESGLGFLNEVGTFVRLKKLKHLLHAVLRWREQRQEWRQSQQAKKSAVDDALEPCLRLVASEKHNDLLLQCTVGTVACPQLALVVSVARPLKTKAPKAPAVAAPELPCEQLEQLPRSRSGSTTASSDEPPVEDRMGKMQRELERLRMENSSLRAVNQVLHFCGMPMPDACSGMSNLTKSLPTPQLPAEIFDDPFEPPPEAFWSSRTTSSADLSNVDGTSELSYGSSSSTSGTPSLYGLHSACSSGVASGAMTPVHPLALIQQQQACTFVPMWFSFSAFSGIDVSVIPHGIVQSACAHFENLGSK